MDINNKWFSGIPEQEGLPVFRGNRSLPKDFSGWCYDSRYEAVQHVVNGKIHREDGPAMMANSVYYWYQNGGMHRLDGPARIDFRGCPEYNEHWINSEYYEEEDYFNHPLVIKTKLERILCL